MATIRFVVTPRSPQRTPEEVFLVAPLTSREEELWHSQKSHKRFVEQRAISLHQQLIDLIGNAAHSEQHIPRQKLNRGRVKGGRSKANALLLPRVNSEEEGEGTEEGSGQDDCKVQPSSDVVNLRHS